MAALERQLVVAAVPTLPFRFRPDRSIGPMSEFERLSEMRASHTRSDLTPNLGAAALGGKRSFDHLVGKAKY